MLKIKKETVLQKEIIDTCTKLGGFGKKTQDKYIKGQPDLWLKLPSGLIIWAEVKVVRNILYTISVPFMPLQLDPNNEYIPAKHQKCYTAKLWLNNMLHLQKCYI